MQVGVDPGLIEFVLTVIAGYLLAGLVVFVIGVIVLLFVLNKMRGGL